MNLKDYLLLMLEQKYRLTPEDGTVLVAVISAIRHREIPVALKSCPRLDAFKESGLQGVYEAVKLNSAWFSFVIELQHAKTQDDVYALLNALMDHSYTGVSKLALVLTSEWQYVGQLVSFSTEAEPETPAEQATAAYNGWLATGKYKLVIPHRGEEDGPDGEVVYDLTVNDQGDVPVEVLLARVIHASFDPATMQVVPERLENVTKLLAQLFQHERAHHELQVKKLVEQQPTAPTSAAKIWPTDDNHWIYEPEISKLNVAWPTPMTNPLRATLANQIERTAKFAVSRASGMGSSRVFNIEAFLHNMVVGLIGDGAPAEGDFDWANFLGVIQNPELSIDQPFVRQFKALVPQGVTTLTDLHMEGIAKVLAGAQTLMPAPAKPAPAKKPAAKPAAKTATKPAAKAK